MSLRMPNILLNLSLFQALAMQIKKRIGPTKLISLPVADFKESDVAYSRDEDLGYRVKLYTVYLSVAES